jgi:predicted secreted hydrolase
MRRRMKGSSIAWLCALLLTAAARAAVPPPAVTPASTPGSTPADSEAPPAVVVPGYRLEFPRDFGSHPQFGIEWWYVTGWLQTADQQPLGFQITFFRSRQSAAQTNPSAFAPRQLLIAHCAISDPARGRSWQDQRIRRAGLGLAEAETGDTRVWIDDWTLARGAGGYQAQVTASDFALHLNFEVTQPVLLNGDAGYSRKGPAPRSASYYYSQPQLRVSGSIERAGRTDAVTGQAWLDHEWSSQYLDADADGWDWVGLNLDDGSALMAFRIRGRQGDSYWAGGTLRDASGQVRVFTPEEVQFTPGRRWRSPRSGISYPVSWRLRVGSRQFDIQPLLDDQENDARLSSGTIYWEGAVRVQEQPEGQPQGAHPTSLAGAGYLELTGYQQALSLP